MRNQKGFTLIELLVVIAILGILAAVVVPAVASFIGSGEDESMATERQNVGLGIGAVMTEGDGTYAISSVFDSSSYIDNNVLATSVAPWTRDLSGASLCTNCASPLSDYMESDTTKWCYSWDTTGRVTQCTQVRNPNMACEGCP